MIALVVFAVLLQDPPEAPPFKTRIYSMEGMEDQVYLFGLLLKTDRWRIDPPAPRFSPTFAFPDEGIVPEPRDLLLELIRVQTSAGRALERPGTQMRWVNGALWITMPESVHREVEPYLRWG